MTEAMVDQVRRFNRVVTERVGALDDRFLGRKRPLGEARVLWEVGRDGCEVRLLRSRLGLDSECMSSLFSSIETTDVIRRIASNEDQRTRITSITRATRQQHR